jgi:hypothetical protein
VTRSSLLALLRLAVAAVLLAVVVRMVGGAEILGRLAAIDLRMFLGALALALVGQFFNAMRWRWLLSVAVPAPPRVAYLFVLVMVGMFANFLMPSSVGGDVVRAEMLKSDVGGRMHAYFSILVGRVLALFAMVAIGTLAMAGAYLAIGWFEWQIAAGGAAVTLAAAAFSAWALRGGVPVSWGRWVPPRVRQGLARSREAIAAYAGYPKVLWGVFAFAAFANVVGTIGVVWILAHGLGLEIPAYFHFIAVPLVVFVTLVPVSFNGIGLREGAFAYLYGLAAVEGMSAVSLSLSFTAVLAVCSLLGGLFLLLPRRAWPGAGGLRPGA